MIFQIPRNVIAGFGGITIASVLLRNQINLKVQNNSQAGSSLESKIYASSIAALAIPTYFSYKIYRHKGPILWQCTSRSSRLFVNLALKPLSAFLVCQGIVTPTRYSILNRDSSDDYNINRLLRLEGEIEAKGDIIKKIEDLEEFSDVGIGRVTRHPVFWGTFLWCLANVINNGTPVRIFANAMAPSFMLCSSLFEDWSSNDTFSNQLYLKTSSFIPFKAILAGDNSWDLAKLEIRWFTGESFVLITILYCMMSS